MFLLLNRRDCSALDGKKSTQTLEESEKNHKIASNIIFWKWNTVEKDDMDADGEDLNPLVPHNSMTDCRSESSKNETYQIRYKVNDKIPRKKANSASLRSSIVDDVQGIQVIDSLRSRLYDRPENSDVFKAISRTPLASNGTKVT